MLSAKNTTCFLNGEKMNTKFNWYAIAIAIVLICTIVWLITGYILPSVILAPLYVDGLLLIEIWCAARTGI